MQDSLALIDRADLFAGVDSSLLHAADLFRTPALAVFGDTNADQWATNFTPTVLYTAPEGEFEQIDPNELAAQLIDLARRY